MAGRPQRRNAISELTARGGPAYVLEFIGNGGTMSELAQEVGWNRVQLSKFVNSDPEYAPVMDAARRANAEAMADETLGIADALAEDRFDLGQVLDAARSAVLENSDDEELAAAVSETLRARLERRTVSSEEVAAAKVRIDTRKWMAAMNNPERFAPKPPQAQVQVNIGSLHLDALRRRALPGDAAKLVGEAG